MKLGHFAASLQFAKNGKDTCSLSGTLSGLPSGFDPAEQVLVLNIGGVSATFTLNAKGMAKAPTDAFQLKLKTTRDKTTKKSTFKGGDGPFKASLKKGTFADAWADEGIALGTSVKNKPMTMIVTISLGGVTYVTTANVLATISPGKTGHLKN